MSSIDCEKTATVRDVKHLRFVSWCDLYYRFDGNTGPKKRQGPGSSSPATPLKKSPPSQSSNNCIDRKPSNIRHKWIKNLFNYVPSGPRFNVKISSYQYRKFHCGDKTVVRSSYPHNGISYTGKMTSLFWIRPQITNEDNFHHEDIGCICMKVVDKLTVIEDVVTILVNPLASLLWYIFFRTNPLLCTYSNRHIILHNTWKVKWMSIHISI